MSRTINASSNDRFELDFIGIGAAKAGTTWLATCLAEHPQICMSNDKELSYFCRTMWWPNAPKSYKEKPTWLTRQFKDWQPGQLRGEYSTIYLIDSTSPALISSHSQHVKLLVSYRNPVDGLWSLYHELRKRRPVPDTFEDCLEAYPHLLEYGNFYKHTCRFLQIIDADRFHFMVYDDISSDPQQVAAALYGFLGVEQTFQPSMIGQRVNPRQAARSIFLRNTINACTDLLNSRPLAVRVKNILRSFKLHDAANWLTVRNLQSYTPPPMRPDTQARLLDLYAEQTILLGKLLGRDLSHWNR